MSDKKAKDINAISEEWMSRRAQAWAEAQEHYAWAIKNGIDEEVASMVLPQTPTPSRKR